MAIVALLPLDQFSCRGEILCLFDHQRSCCICGHSQRLKQLALDASVSALSSGGFLPHNGDYGYDKRWRHAELAVQVPPPPQLGYTVRISGHSRKLAARDASLAAQLGQLWHLLLQIACKNPEHQDKLVDILVDMSLLPDVTKPGDHGQDEPLILHRKQVWKDLPMLDWEIWRHLDYSIPAPGTKKPEEREAAITRTVNVNRFLALLVATEEPIFEWGSLLRS
ncbi:hypothetical protein Aspvir_001645 [Aspergillus viridinutans]|uniref:Uncharacterized protein n=1 Tax=Aspergillus viridinutans TaxID=75553 RepID=A0A9P3BNB3_ASPVI|nr:uncharacterized protein Aspvir_001645 [Aspergillus viridinutans]GIJ99512.1 hypothetical protein Aspvir_001645 [Aspergillus viridinutans]